MLKSIVGAVVVGSVGYVAYQIGKRVPMIPSGIPAAGRILRASYLYVSEVLDRINMLARKEN